MLIEPVILAAGYGTRLQSVVSDVPKPLASVNGRPFISYLLDQLINAGFESVLICEGYRHKDFVRMIGWKYKKLSINYADEQFPHGPGSSLKSAFPLIKSEYALVLNADTLVDIDLRKYISDFLSSGKVLSVVVSEDKNAGMYIIPSRFIANLNIEEPIHVYQAKGFLDIGTPETYKLAQELLK